MLIKVIFQRRMVLFGDTDVALTHGRRPEVRAEFGGVRLTSTTIAVRIDVAARGAPSDGLVKSAQADDFDSIVVVNTSSDSTGRGPCIGGMGTTESDKTRVLDIGDQAAASWGANR